jgi:cyclic pyranopterin phosphate synthase
MPVKGLAGPRRCPPRRPFRSAYNEGDGGALATGEMRLSQQARKDRMEPLSHFDKRGASRMVDVGDKPVTVRTALASGQVRMQPPTLARVRQRDLGKGDVLEVARLAGIMGAKQTAQLIPLCHPLGLDAVKVDFTFVDDRTVRITATAQVTARTGVEMEALTAVTVAALTIYDMCKSVDRSMTLGPFVLEEKTGGASGTYKRRPERSGQAVSEDPGAGQEPDGGSNC